MTKVFSISKDNFNNKNKDKIWSYIQIKWAAYVKINAILSSTRFTINDWYGRYGGLYHDWWPNRYDNRNVKLNNVVYNTILNILINFFASHKVNYRSVHVKISVTGIYMLLYVDAPSIIKSHYFCLLFHW